MKWFSRKRLQVHQCCSFWGPQRRFSLVPCRRTETHKSVVNGVKDAAYGMTCPLAYLIHGSECVTNFRFKLKFEPENESYWTSRAQKSCPHSQVLCLRQEMPLFFLKHPFFCKTRGNVFCLKSYTNQQGKDKNVAGILNRYNVYRWTIISPQTFRSLVITWDTKKKGFQKSRSTKSPKHYFTTLKFCIFVERSKVKCDWYLKRGFWRSNHGIACCSVISLFEMQIFISL